MSKGDSCSIGLSGILFVVFLVLKLTHNIDWSWWWICAPLWIEACIVIFVLLVMSIIALALHLRWK